MMSPWNRIHQISCASFEERASSPYDSQPVTHTDEGLSFACPFCKYVNPLVLWVAEGRFVDEFITRKSHESVYFACGLNSIVVAHLHSETYLEARVGTKNTYYTDAIYSKAFGGE